MPEFRYNILTGEWVLIATERSKRPIEFAQSVVRPCLPMHDPNCPFCPGNESHTTAEIERRNAPDGAWQTRVIKNKFPALDELAKPDHGGDFFHTRINGFGVHEVVVAPRCDDYAAFVARYRNDIVHISQSLSRSRTRRTRQAHHHI